MTTFTAWVTEMFTFRENGYTVAMAFATKIVEIQWLPLMKIGFLMKCEKFTLRKCPLIPYVPKKDCVQETVSLFKNNHLKMQISKGIGLRIPIWHSGTHEAFLIHVGLPENLSRKRGTSKPTTKQPWPIRNITLRSSWQRLN
jgi:hypothetical protein